MRNKRESQVSISTPKHSKITGGGLGIDGKDIKSLGDKFVEMTQVITQIGKISINWASKSAIEKIWSNKLAKLEENTKDMLNKSHGLQSMI